MFRLLHIVYMYIIAVNSEETNKYLYLVVHIKFLALDYNEVAYEIHFDTVTIY